jgi:hypothetical protein
VKKYTRDVSVVSIFWNRGSWVCAQLHNMIRHAAPVPLEHPGDKEEGFRIPWGLNPGIDNHINDDLVSPFWCR